MGRKLAWCLVAPATAAVVLLLVLPVAATFATTFMDPKGVFQPYVTFFASSFRQTVLYRTIQIALTTTAISVIVGFLTAYVVAGTSGRLKSVLIVAAVFPLLTGVVVRSFAWMVILGKNGILNATLVALGLVDQPLPLLFSQGAVVTGMVYLFVPLMILTLVGVLENIPRDVIEASTSLGAGPITTFFKVILPLAVPGLIVGAVLVFTGSFTAYATPQLLGGERNAVLGTLMYQRAMVMGDWMGASTIAAIMVVVTLTIIFAMTRLARRLNPQVA